MTEFATPRLARINCRETVDFNRVTPGHAGMDCRLVNWASWCRSRTAQGVAPGFELHKSPRYDDREYGSATATVVDKMDAARVQKGVAQLPEKHRHAIAWCYIKRRNPPAKASQLGVSLQGLADLVADARQILINRGV